MKDLPGKNRKVLIVEDEAAIRETFREALEFEGYSVQTAKNGEEGLSLLLNGLKPNLVLLDMLMPVMGGREFLNHVSEDRTLAAIPVLVVSATAQPSDTEGASDFLRKPTDLDVLLRLVDQYSVEKAQAS